MKVCIVLLIILTSKLLDHTKRQVLLVLGAAGGVGLSDVQIGKIIGATVIVVARCVFHLHEFYTYLF